MPVEKIIPRSEDFSEWYNQVVISAELADYALENIQRSLFDRALAVRQADTYNPRDYMEFREVVKSGWAHSWWCGNAQCEARIKDETKATARCIPFDQPGGSGQCICCGKPASEKVLFARAY